MYISGPYTALHQKSEFSTVFDTTRDSALKVKRSSVAERYHSFIQTVSV